SWGGSLAEPPDDAAGAETAAGVHTPAKLTRDGGAGACAKASRATAYVTNAFVTNTLTPRPRGWFGRVPQKSICAPDLTGLTNSRSSSCQSWEIRSMNHEHTAVFGIFPSRNEAERAVDARAREDAAPAS